MGTVDTQQAIQENIERTLGAMQLRIIALETENVLLRQALDALEDVPDETPSDVAPAPDS